MLLLTAPTSSPPSSWWNFSFEEHSIAWLLISGVIGGIIGAFIKLSFENILPFRLQQRRNLLAVQRRYSIPILLASEALRNRLDNIIRLIQEIETEEWLSREDYYYTSTLYTVSLFWGWIGILRRSVMYLDWQSLTKTRKFERLIDTIEKGFSNPSLLYHPTEITDWCYTYELQAIGEIMRVKSDGEGEYRVLGYSEFNKMYDTNEDFKSWIKKLDRLFKDLKSEEDRFKRLIATHALLNNFINYLDPKHIYTNPENDHLDELTEEQRANIERLIAQ